MGRVETDIIILGHFMISPAHGYELKQRIDRSFGNTYINIINSLLYPRLAEMESNGYIEGHREMQEKVPDKKVYRITEPGKKQFKQLVATPVKMKKGVLPDFMDLTVHAVFFSHITKKEREKVIRPFYEAYRAGYEKSVEALQIYGPKMDKFTLTMTKSASDQLERNIEIIEKLLKMD
jgi:DNA-binding PadR family transcriptional regulator